MIAKTFIPVGIVGVGCENGGFAWICWGLIGGMRGCNRGKEGFCELAQITRISWS